MRQHRLFELETVNIRDAGQERWLRRYVYWIPALHLDGREVAKGRWGEEEVRRALEEWDGVQLRLKEKEEGKIKEQAKEQTRE